MTTVCHKPHTTTIRTSSNLRRRTKLQLHSLTNRMLQPHSLTIKILLRSLPKRPHLIPPIRRKILSQPIRRKILSQLIRRRILSQPIRRRVLSQPMEPRNKNFLLLTTMAVEVKKQPPLLLSISSRITLVCLTFTVPQKKQPSHLNRHTSSRTTSA